MASKEKKAEHQEFGGPIGTAITTIALPLVVVWLSHCSRKGFVDVSPQAISLEEVCPNCLERDSVYQSAVILTLWMLLQIVLWKIIPGQWVEGVAIQGPKEHEYKLKYKINGHACFWMNVILAGALTYCRPEYWLVLHEQTDVLGVVTIVACSVGSLVLYINSFIGQKTLADGGDSGNFFYDFFMGRELNPRTASFDWKQFCELRPGLVGWMLLNFSCLWTQYKQLGYVTGSMACVNIFQAVYVWDANFQERAILTTMDITTDGFGFMLLFGDLAWVPFTYSLQARYMVEHDPHFGWVELGLILALHIFGFWIFRSANGQKDAFRRDPKNPKLAHLNFMQTKRGTKLLVSGWWGLARKINYTGDWIMGLTWCLVAGFDSIVPFYYAIYFAILLIHRSIRDDHMCQEKYGDDWVAYKERVPYRFIPGIL